ncbi:tetratricopeptide repeat protein [Candidatus Ulvibacter alkanivorans]|uniref:tetratricopeptide repeat protein n=1 Tax=Candidatus Ulvibacter alkanivorans TaxID=2267620 RepID=UPI000DF4365F|nr:tetratricopeptide repeat protein [Candidatus Ulvibacter alkanivorans]
MNRYLILFFVFFISEAEAQPSASTLEQTKVLKTGDSLYATGNYTEAINSYNSLHDNSKYERLAKSYEALGNTPKALTNYELAIAHSPNKTTHRFRYGKLLQISGRYRQADSIFTQLSTEYPTNASFLYQRGLIGERLNDTTAIRFFSDALQIDPTHENARYKVARRAVEKRNFEKAQPIIEQGLKTDPNSIRFLTLAALSSYYSSNYHQALKHYEHLVSLNQSNEQLHENLGISYMRTNQFEEALEQFTILINTYDDKNPSWHYHVGKVFMSLKEYEKAIRHIELSIALQQVPLDAEFMTLATIYKRKGDNRQVFDMMKHAFSENPKDEMVAYQFAVAADNYFEDIETIIQYYETYLEQHGETGRFRELAKQRLSDLKKELHYSKD